MGGRKAKIGVKPRPDKYGGFVRCGGDCNGKLVRVMIQDRQTKS